MSEQVTRQAPPCFTREQTEALKQFAGIDEFSPSLWEVKKAGEVFKLRLAELAQDVADEGTSTDTAINCAAAAVWRAARRYQSEKQAVQTAKVTAAKQAKPSGIRKLLHLLPIKRKGA